MGNIKGMLKEKLIEGRQKKYFAQMEKKTVSYGQWIVKQENALREKTSSATHSLTVKRVLYEDAADYLCRETEKKDDADIILFLADEGAEAELAEPLLCAFFEENPEIAMVYGDEDVISPLGERFTPWLKPDWSPDTFLTAFYFGSVFAVRSSLLRQLGDNRAAFLETLGRNVRAGLYDMCMLLAEKCGGFERKGEVFPIGHISEILFHSFYNRETELLYREVEQKEERKQKAPMVSVIIPSKDHAEIIKKCIESVEKTVDASFEIIVVDNGSCESQKEELQRFLQERAAVYLYEVMPFHFSKMCNRGAEEAKGEILLFLNDDIEVPECPEKDWLCLLAEQAAKPYTGAVGVKLFYPDSEKIQHAGIVNLRLGPVHKQQFKEDNASCCFGWNRGNRNVIAVTGACLAVEKKKFQEAGGFPEELPIAFNDVDFCFSLFEKGYYNVVMQEIRLFHHESLSRGQDAEKEKLERLTRERRKLYERHPVFYGYDPFYHKYFAGDMLSTGFELRADYEWQDGLPYARVVKRRELPMRAREDGCVMISLEYAGSLLEWKCGSACAEAAKDTYYLQGYAFVVGSDNACYEKKIILQASGRDTGCLLLHPIAALRRDVEENLPDQKNVGMTGFAAKVKAEDIATGEYRIGILMKDQCSGQQLFAWTNRWLSVKGTGLV